MNTKLNQNWSNQIIGKNKAKREKKLEKSFDKYTKHLKSQSVVASLLTFDWDAIRGLNKTLTDNENVEMTILYQDICDEINNDISKARKKWNNNQTQLYLFKEMNAEACQ
jgi:hypothetical protein